MRLRRKSCPVRTSRMWDEGKREGSKHGEHFQKSDGEDDEKDYSGSIKPLTVERVPRGKTRPKHITSYSQDSALDMAIVTKIPP